MSPSKHIYNSGIIGNCAYIAHVNLDTNISWLCWPTFQDSFVFGGLLDEHYGGEYAIRPVSDIISATQSYVENTNVLCTTIESNEGAYRVTDFAPRFEQYERYFKPLIMIRKIEPLQGRPRIKVTCDPVYQYGKTILNKHRGSNHIQFENGDVRIRLATDIPISHFFDESAHVLSKPVYLVLTFGSPFEAPIARTCEEFLSRTIAY